MPRAVTVLSSFLATVALARAQHCGGPCEVPRGPDPVAIDPRYTLTPGPERANWRYLHNWLWTENGTPKHRLEEVLRAAPCRSFGYRRMFVSPAGNGFLVTGNAYAAAWLEGNAPPLFVFCAPDGSRAAEVLVNDVLTAEERQLGKCPGCSCCTEVMHVFAEDPAVSRNGCFVELKAAVTRRPLAFFLPLGLPVLDRAGFDAALVAAERAALPPDTLRWHADRIAELVERLLVDDDGVRIGAGDELADEGWLALGAVRDARARATSNAARGRLTAVEGGLRPWRVVGWDTMAIDLGLHAALRSQRDPPLARAVRARLDRLVPQTKAMDAAACAAWLEAHRGKLKWNATTRAYDGP
jgi:hypothetical protein